MMSFLMKVFVVFLILSLLYTLRELKKEKGKVTQVNDSVIVQPRVKVFLDSLTFYQLDYASKMTLSSLYRQGFFDSLDYGQKMVYADLMHDLKLDNLDEWKPYMLQLKMEKLPATNQ
ncbi:hypothetical protein [Yersinia phage vB_YenM_P778]